MSRFFDRSKPGASHRHAFALFALAASACGAPTEDRSTPSGGGSGAGPTGGAPVAGTTPATTGGAAGVVPVAGSTATPTGGVAGGDVSVPAGGSGGAAAVAGASGSAGVVTTTPGQVDWTMIGYDISSSYFNRGETVLTKDNAATLEEIWTADLIGNVYGAPLQIGDIIYASGPSQVRAYEAATGVEKWHVSVGTTASIAFADDTLYVNTTSGQVVALDAADGHMLWTKQPATARADGSSSPVVAGDLVVVGGSSGGIELTTGAFRGYLSALNRMTGDVAWTTYTVPEGANGASIWSSASADVAAGRIYGTTGNNYGEPATDTSDSIIAFDMASGDIIWKNQRVEGDAFVGFSRTSGPDYDFGANPVLYETMVGGVMTQLVSAGAKSGAAHAVRRDDGSLVWTRSMCTGTSNGSSGIFVNSTWSGKLMLFACNEGGPATLYGLDGATGDVVWMRKLPGQVWGRMSVANGVGFVGTGTTLEAFDVDTGALIKSIPSKGGTVAGTISISRGRVAFGEGLSWSTGVRGQMLTVLAVH